MRHESMASEGGVVPRNWRIFVCFFTSVLIDKERALAAASESIARIPGLRGVYSWQAFCRITFAACSEDVCFGWQIVLLKTAVSGDLDVIEMSLQASHLDVWLADPHGDGIPGHLSIS